MRRLANISFKNKIFISTLAVILLLSVGIGLIARWVVISSLTSQLKRRGIGIAQSVVESSRTHILTEDNPKVISLLFDAARLGERKLLIAYMFILDQQDSVLAHTFIDIFPEDLLHANKLGPEQSESIKLIQMGGESIYDIAVPVQEGIYQIGTLHVGLNKKPIKQLIGKLRNTFIGFISAITIIFFGISHWLSRLITRPISQLTKISDEISWGNLDIKTGFGAEGRCWEIRNCEHVNCPAYENTDLPCWFVDETSCDICLPCKFPEKLKFCHECTVYKNHSGDEILQLGHSFSNMMIRLKSFKAELRKSEEKYRSLFDSGPDPIFVLDCETLKILDANPSAVGIYGYSKEELRGKSFTKLGAFEYVDSDFTQLERRDRPIACTVGSKVRHYKKGKKPFYVNVHACLARYEDRDSIIVATTDITEMIEKDAQLIQASKMTILGEMSAGIAHELNQPLNAIKMGNEFLRMMVEKGKTIPEKDLLHVANEVNIQVDRAAEIINHLREFGRKADLTREEVDINSAIRNVIAIIGDQLKLQNIVIKTDLDETVPPILAHSNRLEQVIFNLVTNARDAIRQKKSDTVTHGPHVISIRSFSEDDRVAITVSDTGVGISEAVKNRIFEPFFTTKEVGKGVGLGLSITYGIIRDYGGEIDIHSKENVGTTFKLAFPFALS